jgi:integrase
LAEIRSLTGFIPLEERAMKARVPSLRQHKPTKRAVVTIAGRDHYCGPWGSKQAENEYKRLTGEWLASGGAPAGPSRAAISVAELVLAYRRFAKGYYASPSKEESQIRLALRPVVERYGHTLARDFGPLALKAVRQVWVDAGLARGYINQRVGRVVRAWGWAVENELVPAECWQALKAVKGLRKGRSTAKETPPVLPVPDSVFEATLAEIGSPQVRAILRVMRLTGARPGEICNMRTGDIDRTTSPWEYRPETHKTAHRGHDKVIYIGPRAQAILTDWLRADPEAYLFQPREATEAVRDSTKVDGRSDADRARAARNKRATDARKRGGKARNRRLPGVRYTPGRLGHAIGRACERAGIEHWHPHQIRHAAATELRREIGIEAARVVLGHRSPGMAELYAEADRAAAAAHMARLG